MRSQTQAAVGRWQVSHEESGTVGRTIRRRRRARTAWRAARTPSAPLRSGTVVQLLTSASNPPEDDFAVRSATRNLRGPNVTEARSACACPNDGLSTPTREHPSSPILAEASAAALQGQHRI